MSIFQGFKVTGIDPNQYPVFTDDNDMRENLFYLTLEPVGTDDADHENRRLWDYCFRGVIEHLNDFERAESLPKLKFIFDADGDVFISASGKDLRSLDLFAIESLVGRVNERFIRWANDVTSRREEIKRINNSFRERVIYT